jgi:hypothetical protein
LKRSISVSVEAWLRITVVLRVSWISINGWLTIIRLRRIAIGTVRVLIGIVWLAVWIERRLKWGLIW